MTASPEARALIGWRMSLAAAVLFVMALPSGARAQTIGPEATATPSVQPTRTATATPGAMSDADVAAMVAPSVVRISAGQNGASGVMTRHGILTNDHVVTGLTEVEVFGSDGTQRTATVVRSDAWYDLALLSTDLAVPALELEPVRSHRQGDPLLAMGYPFAQFLEGPPSLSRGILSAIREIDGVVYVQTDAAMNFGSSGGAIVNTRGKLVALARGGIGSFGGINFGVGAESIDGFVAGVVIVGPDAAEPDDAMDQARPLAVGTPALEHNFHRAGDVDWVVLQLVEDESVVVFTDSPRCDTYMALFGPDGTTLLAEDDDSGGNVSSAIAFTATEPGAYYARVSHFEPQGRCRAYSLGAAAGGPEAIDSDAGEEDDGDATLRIRSDGFASNRAQADLYH